MASLFTAVANSTTMPAGAQQIGEAWQHVKQDRIAVSNRVSSFRGKIDLTTTYVPSAG
jgi:hypothetical protein